MWAAPAWSPPDARGESKIAFGVALSPSDSERSRYALFAMDRDGGNKQQIFPQAKEDGLQIAQVAWSPNASLIGRYFPRPPKAWTTPTAPIAARTRSRSSGWSASSQPLSLGPNRVLDVPATGRAQVTSGAYGDTSPNLITRGYAATVPSGLNCRPAGALLVLETVFQGRKPSTLKLSLLAW